MENQPPQTFVVTDAHELRPQGESDWTKYTFRMACADLPAGISMEPNARQPNIRGKIYKNMKNELLDKEDGRFYIRNAGITILADSVKKVSDNEWLVDIKPEQGIVDGGHTYTVIQAAKDEGLPPNQFVSVTVFAGNAAKIETDLVRGRNTSKQVKQMSILNKRGLFDEWKDVVGKNQKHIKWRESDSGEIDANDLIRVLTLFNISAYPNGDDTKYPSKVYSGKATLLEEYERSKYEFLRLRNIANDILCLHDYISFTAKDLWNQQGLRVGPRGIFKLARSKTSFLFPFIGEAGERGESRLERAALFPVLGAFRYFVRGDASGPAPFHWDRDFSELTGFWDSHGHHLLKIANKRSRLFQEKLNSLGKDFELWMKAYAFVRKWGTENQPKG